MGGESSAQEGRVGLSGRGPGKSRKSLIFWPGESAHVTWVPYPSLLGTSPGRGQKPHPRSPTGEGSPPSPGSGPQLLPSGPSPQGMPLLSAHPQPWIELIGGRRSFTFITPSSRSTLNLMAMLLKVNKTRRKMR